MAFTTKELSVHTFPDFERVALKKGWCWCMHYQRPRPVYDNKLPRAERRPINKRDKKMLVRKGSPHAILVYDGETPVVWCQYGTADELPRIDAGRELQEGWTPERDREIVEDHLLLRRQEIQKKRRRQTRP